MSCVVAYIQPSTLATICCDGRLSRRQPDGSLTPVGELSQKMWPINSEIAVGVTGSVRVGALLSDRLREHAGTPGLFETLVTEIIPSSVRKILADLKREGTGDEGAGVLLVGYCDRTKCIRAVHFSTEERFGVSPLSPYEESIAHGGVAAIGNAGASEAVQDLALENLRALVTRFGQDQSPQFIFRATREMLRDAIRAGAERFPHSINSNIWSFTITVPALREELRRSGFDKLEVPGALQFAEADGVTYNRIKAIALANGIVKAAHISNQSVGQLIASSTLVSATVTSFGGGWELVATATINIPDGTASISLNAAVPHSDNHVAGIAVDGVGWSIYTGTAPATPQVSGSGTLSNPTTGVGVTLGLYVHSSTSGTLNTTSATPSVSQTVQQILNADVLT